MRHSNISSSLICFGMALARDLPDVSYEAKERRPYSDELKVYSFPQTWGSTALGFGGMGGAAITTAQTTVIICNLNMAVYFGEQLAYVVKGIDMIAVIKDLCEHNMAAQDSCDKYRRKSHD